MTKQIPKLQYNWTSFGTARSKFIKDYSDVTIKNKLGYSNFPESLLLLKQQFAEIQIGSEYFFQAMNFLCHAKKLEVNQQNKNNHERTSYDINNLGTP